MADQRRTVALVDLKGDQTKLMLAGLAARAPERLEADVRYLDPFLLGFPFNLVRLNNGDDLDILATGLAGIIAETSTAAGAQRHLGVGARQVDVLVHLVLAALTVPDQRAHLLLALDALTLPQGLRRLGSLTTSARARTFCETTRLGEELVASTASRLRTALAPTTAMERLVCAPTCISLDDLLGPGRCTIVNLGSPPGGLEVLQRFYGNVLVRLFVDALMRRPSPCPELHHVRLVVDEAQVVVPVLTDVAERVLTTGRSRNVSLALLSQTTVLLDPPPHSLLAVLSANAPHRYVGRLGAQDAERLARELTASPGVETSRGSVRDSFIAQASNLPDREFFHLGPGVRQRFRTVDADLPIWEEAAAQHAGAIAAVQRRFALPPNTQRRVTLDDLAPLADRQRSARPKTRTRATTPRSPRTRWG